jgi:hypothetical protein
MCASVVDMVRMLVSMLASLTSCPWQHMGAPWHSMPGVLLVVAAWCSQQASGCCACSAQGVRVLRAGTGMICVCTVACLAQIGCCLGNCACCPQELEVICYVAANGCAAHGKFHHAQHTHLQQQGGCPPLSSISLPFPSGVYWEPHVSTW